MYDFAYHTASSAADAAAKAKGKSDAKYMAGGQTLIPTLKQRLAKPTDVIDLGGARDLKGISAAGGAVTIGRGRRLGRRQEGHPGPRRAR